MNLFRNVIPVLWARESVTRNHGRKIGISRQNYSGIETGKREMQWNTIWTLLAFFPNNEQTKPMIDI